MALYYAHEIDNYVKIVKGVKGYGRFTDDSYIIHQSREFLEQLLSDISKIAGNLGIHINKKKTKIISLSRPFSILQTRYRLYDNGKLIKEVSRSTIKRERKRLRKFRKRLDNGEIDIDYIFDAYHSWRGSLKHFNSSKQVFKIDLYFKELFGDDLALRRYLNSRKPKKKDLRKLLSRSISPEDYMKRRIQYEQDGDRTKDRGA